MHTVKFAKRHSVDVAVPKILTDLFQVLVCVFHVELVQAAACFHDLLCMNLDITGLPLHTMLCVSLSFEGQETSPQVATRPQGPMQYRLRNNRDILKGLKGLSRDLATAPGGVLHCRLTEAPPEGWCSMMRLLGSERRSRGSPAARSSDAMDAACPMHVVCTGLRRYCMQQIHSAPSALPTHHRQQVRVHLLSCN